MIVANKLVVFKPFIQCENAGTVNIRQNYQNVSISLTYVNKLLRKDLHMDRKLQIA